MGVVEGSPSFAYFCFYFACFFVFLVWDAVSLCGNGRDLGTKVFNFCVILFNFSFIDVAFSRGKHVYGKNDDVRIFSVHNCFYPIVLEMK